MGKEKCITYNGKENIYTHIYHIYRVYVYMCMCVSMCKNNLKMYDFAIRVI